MSDVDPVWREFARYIVATRSEINKLVAEIDQEEIVEIDRLHEFINCQTLALVALKLSLDMCEKEI